jgi:hypothetical protein
MSASKKPKGTRDAIYAKRIEREARFVLEYLVDLNASQAAKRAGYNGNAQVLGVAGHRLLKNPKIAASIAEKQAQYRANLELTAERVTREVSNLAFGDARALYHPDGRLKLPHEMTRDEFALVAAIDHEELWDWQPIGSAAAPDDQGKPAKKKGGGERTERVQVGVVRKVKRYSRQDALMLASDLLGLRKQAGAAAQAAGLVIQIQASDGKPIR